MAFETGYDHRQHSPLCLIVYAIAALFVVLGDYVIPVPQAANLFMLLGLLLLVLATSFHYLRVRNQDDELLINFGPIPLLRRRVRFDDIMGVEQGRTTLLDGWGIHLSMKGGWVWNIWGRDCVVLTLRKSKLTIGTNDVEGLVRFLRTSLPDTPVR